MLTNCHTLILRRLLERHPATPHAGMDAYVYNVAPDALPLSEEFNARDTHRFAPPQGALAAHPKLIWVKCHLVVDNICHYGAMSKSPSGLGPGAKQGYTYKKGAELIPLMSEFAREMEVSLDAETTHYLAHVLVEIAVDYAIYLDDRTVSLTLRDAQRQMDESQKREYAQSLATLYGCAPAQVARAMGAPKRFYGKEHDIDYLYLDGRTKIILRKLKLAFDGPGTDSARRLIQDAAALTGDYERFVGHSVDLLSDWAAWAGERALESGTG